MIEIFENIRKKTKNTKMTNIAFVLGLCGIALIAFSSFFGNADAKSENTGTAENTVAIENIADEYSQKKQAELEALLSQISGVGKVKVMLNVVCSQEYVYAIFESEKSSTSPDSTESEYSYEYFTYKEQNDDAPLMTKVLTPQIGSCVIACQGASSSVVREQVYMAASKALGIEVSHIYVAELS